MSGTEAVTEGKAKVRANSRWLAATLGLLALLVLVDVGISWWMDPFGVWRNAAGRHLLASEDERRAKALLNEDYVPENFDALIIGSSASMSWRPDLLTGYKFYDESVEGANASELRAIVEPALKKGHFKVALMVAHPLITSFHDLGDGLGQVSRREALGSISSIKLEWEMIEERRHPHAELRSADGRRVKNIHTQPWPGDVYARYNVDKDPVALEDYRGLVEDLGAHGVKVIYVTYPLYAPFYAVNAEVLAAYSKEIAEMMPAGPMIDFNTPEFAEFRGDATNYVDKIHLSAAGSEKLTRIINERMHQILGS